MNIIPTALGDTARLVDAIATNDAKRCLELHSYEYRYDTYLVFEQRDGTWQAGLDGDRGATGATQLDAMVGATRAHDVEGGPVTTERFGGTRAEVAAAMEATG